MKPATSTYYPPRAGVVSRCLAVTSRVWRAWRLALMRSSDATIEQPLHWRWLLVPGLRWIQQGRLRLGQVILGAWCSAVVVYVVALGTPVMIQAIILAAFLHTLSVTSVLVEASVSSAGKGRLVRACVLAMVMVPALYALAPEQTLYWFARPITYKGKEIVMRPVHTNPLKNIKRGDWVVYRISYYNQPITFGRVLALPGETIRFHPDSFEVEGRYYRSVSSRMPKGGSYATPEGDLFIWPADARGRGDWMNMLYKAARVPLKDIIGIPYRHWFGRAQTFEPLTPVDPASLPASPP